MVWNYATDPFYRALLADIADTEWQIVEQDFLDAQRQADRSPSAVASPLASPAPEQSTRPRKGWP